MAIITPNLGLRVWNLTTDPYDHAQLADNWAKVDEHDHSAGRGKQVPTGGIADGAITAIKIAGGVIPSTLTLDDGSVTTAKLANNAVTNGKLAVNSVATGNIINGTIVTADLADSSVTTAKLVTNSVTSPIIAAGAVDTTELNDAGVTPNKISGTLSDYLSVSNASGTRRGFSSNLASENWGGTPGTYSNLPTPDRVQNIVMPADGLIYVAYRALFKFTGSPSNDGKITLFVGSTQLKSVADDESTPVTVDETLSHVADHWSPVTTTPAATGGGSGIFGSQSSTANDSAYDNTQPIAWSADSSIRWAPVIFEAPAGTYDISIRYKTAAASGGTLAVKNRKLWVWTVGF